MSCWRCFQSWRRTGVFGGRCEGASGRRAMPLQRALLFFLWAVLESFGPGCRCGSSRHSLCYSYLKMLESSQGLPQFLSVIHLDDHPIARYDFLDSKTDLLVPWMEEEEEAVKAPERMFRSDLEWLSELNPQTGGLHTWQVIVGCELWEDGRKGGFLNYSYDGMDFISFDKETLRWVAAQPQAEKVKEKWEEDPGWSERNKDFLEKTCMEWLKEALKKEALKKTKPPVGKLTRKVVNGSLEVLICQAFGFYPKEIQATWTKDGEVCQNETLHRNVAPNSDGTYYVQLSIEIDPKERHRFRCHLEHEGLAEPLVLVWEEKTVLLGFVGVVIIVILVAHILCLTGYWLNYRKKLRQATTTHPDYLPLEKLCSSPPHGTEDEIQSAAMLPPKMTSEGCCGQNRQLREGEETPLKASSDAYSDNMEEPVTETSEWGPEEHLEDAEATKRRMEGLEEEGSPDPSEEQADEHLAGEEKGEMQLEGLTDPARSPGWRRIASAADQEG